jgi:RsiW-degrading membrane proteinase PrsW (M82 family)
MSFSLNRWQLVAVILASAMVWVQYVQSKDRHQPEPLRRLLVAFVLGIVACGLSVLGFSALDALGVPEIKYNERPWTAFYCFGIVGPLEEGTKVLLAYLFVFRWREYDEPIDGFVYAATVALGFGCMEDSLDSSNLGWPNQVARTIALPMTHLLFSSIWGFGIGYAHFCVSKPLRKILWQVGSIALAMGAHGLYDFLLFAYQATFVASGLALIIWVFVIWRARQLGHEAKARQTLSERPARPGPQTPRV